MKLGLAALWLLLLGGMAGAQVINCPSGFSASGSCGVSNIGASGQPFQFSGGQNGSSTSGTLSGTKGLILDTSSNHAAITLTYQTLVNVQAFNTTFTFIPNGQNVSFILNNSNNNPTFNGSVFAAGAGCEADFYQGFSQANPPNNVFAVEFDSYSPATTGGSFTYSTVQVYQSHPYVQSPCSPAINGETIYNKLSTSPVALNSPAGTLNTTTGDTYSANLVYNGSSLVVNLFDVTASGACPGVNCYTHTFTSDAAGSAINVTNSVGSSNTAWVGIGGADGTASVAQLTVNSLVYTVNTLSPMIGVSQRGLGGMW